MAITMNMLQNLFNNIQKDVRKQEERIKINILDTLYEAHIYFMSRKSKTLKINSDNHLLIEVKAPLQLTRDDIELFIHNNSEWIVSQSKKIKCSNETHPRKMYVDGERHLLLGNEFTLKVVPSNRRLSSNFEDNILTIYEQNEGEAEKLVRNWYKNIAPTILSPIITPIASAFMLRYGVSYNSIEYKYVSSYWGQCSASKHIRLNIELIRAPKECIEYIMAHELCHLIHPNHSPKFYSLLTDFMPDWQSRKMLLNQTTKVRK